MRQGAIMAGVLLAVLAGPAAGQVHKCVGPDGAVRYTGEPCPAGEQAEARPIEAISITPGMPVEQRQQMDAASRARQQADRAKRQQRVAETGGEVRRIQRENADPAKCAQAREGLARIEAAAGPEVTRGELRYRSFEYRRKVELYCYP